MPAHRRPTLRDELDDPGAWDSMVYLTSDRTKERCWVREGEMSDPSVEISDPVDVKTVTRHRRRGAPAQKLMPGKCGDTYFDGTTTWVCMGGNRWVDQIPREEPPAMPFTQRLADLMRRGR